MNEKNKEDFIKDLTRKYCDQIINDLPKMVKQYRENIGLSQKQFAQNISLSRSTIARVETKGKISLETFIHIQLECSDFFPDSKYEEYRNEYEKEAKNCCCHTQIMIMKKN